MAARQPESVRVITYDIRIVVSAGERATVRQYCGSGAGRIRNFYLKIENDIEVLTDTEGIKLSI